MLNNQEIQIPSTATLQFVSLSILLHTAAIAVAANLAAQVATNLLIQQSNKSQLPTNTNKKLPVLQ